MAKGNKVNGYRNRKLRSTVGFYTRYEWSVSQRYAIWKKFTVAQGKGS